ncbi:MAG: hypothetical protein JKY24_06090, partial [Pseudomonadales bacterium]|nr:hypothetical protein [Pseudomonadales bacterium]
MKAPGRNWILAIVLMGVTALLSVNASAHNDGAYAYDSSVGISEPNWMSKLPDSFRLSDMSLLMTHDTMTYNIDDGGTWSGKSPVTQRMSLTTQLNSGIRAIDIRVKWDLFSQKFRLYHGNEDLGFWLDNDVLDKLQTFL